MDQSIHVPLSVPRFSIGARLLCMQKARELEEAAAFIRNTKGQAAVESEFHYAEKLHALKQITQYLLSEDSAVSEVEFSQAVGVFGRCSGRCIVVLEFISNFWGIGLVFVLLIFTVLKIFELRVLALNALRANHQSKLLLIGEKASEQAKEKAAYAEELEMLKLRYMAGIILFFFIAMVLCLYLWKFNGLAFGDTADVWGQMGDYFGGMLNPIFAFASFMALLYTINIQSKQLEVSTKELEATRKELTASREAQQESSKALELQTFERTLFSQIEYILKLQSRFEVDKTSFQNAVLQFIDNAFDLTNIRKAILTQTKHVSVARMYYSAILDLMSYINNHASSPVFIPRLPTYLSLISNLLDEDDCYFLSVIGSVSTFNTMSLDRYWAMCDGFGIFRNSIPYRINNELYIKTRRGPPQSGIKVIDLGYSERAFDTVHVTII